MKNYFVLTYKSEDFESLLKQFLESEGYPYLAIAIDAWADNVSFTITHCPPTKQWSLDEFLNDYGEYSSDYVQKVFRAMFGSLGVVSFDQSDNAVIVKYPVKIFPDENENGGNGK